MGWTVQGSNLCRSRISCTRPDLLWSLTSLPCNGFGSCPWLKRPGRGVNLPSHLAPIFKNENNYTFFGIESQWGRDFLLVQTCPGTHPASCKIGTSSFPGVKCGRGVLLTTHPLIVPRSWKSRAIPLPTLWATPGL